MKAVVLLSSILMIGLVGCSSVPTSGPSASQVIDQAKQEGQGRFDFVEIDSHVVAALRAQPSQSLGAGFNDEGKPPPVTIGIGDVLSVSIWQSGTGGVLASPPDSASGLPAGGNSGGRSQTIPDQVVAADGGISVPYAGRVPAAGRTPLEVQRTIEQRLADRAIEPQVVVTVTKSVAETVTISGEDISGARVPLTIGGDRLLDVIAAAGGSKSPAYETIVRLTRDGATATIPMKALLTNPSENVFVWPGDLITLARDPQTFSVFGATVNNVDIPFGADRLDLAQAIAKAGGLQDQRADPDGVFLFRFEPPNVVKALGAQVLATAPADPSPVLYHLNLREAASFFLAKRFPMQNDDIIYVANAPMAELQKFFTLIGSISGPVISGAVVTRGTGH